MAAMSRGEAKKPKAKPKQLRAPKRVKGGTESTRNHVWKGFSQRIAQLKIEPVRRGRSTIIDDAELDATFSFFRDSFLEWKELNLSEAFTSFARKVAPLCDSLPQVLHHSDRIFDLLIEYIDKGEKYSEEPLLSLMAHLAHDLGEKFEKFFERAVRTVSTLAATHTDVEVIEWSFSCLAWLFKYLSRLLVPDLRPVFDLMSPLLGKSHQKIFVSRFAAEALSFLLRKAGAAYHRDVQPLRLIVKHMSGQLRDLQESAKDYEFEQGLMYLLTDSLKGVQRGFHSGAVSILRELLAEAYNEDHISLRSPPLEFVLRGVLTAAIHHTDAENFESLLETILAHIQTTAADVRYVALSSRLLFILCGVRHGSRIGEWKSVLDTIAQLLNITKNARELDSVDAWELLPVVALVFQYCALDAAIPNEKLLEEISRGPWEVYFLPFCNLFADLGAERFQSLLLPYFKRFIVQKAHLHGKELCAVLPQLHHSGILSDNSLQPSEKWHAAFQKSFQELAEHRTQTTDELIFYCNALLDVANIFGVSKDKQGDAHNGLEKVLHDSISEKREESAKVACTFATGHGLQYLVKLDDRKTLSILWPRLCAVSPVYGHSLMFWRGMLDLLKRDTKNLDMEGIHMEVLKSTLMRCLGAPSHELRLAAIDILQVLVAQKEDVRSILHVAMLIEQTPLTLDNQRSISMRIGQLAKQYAAVCSDEWAGEAIPTFCFGLLHVRLASAWDDACSALRTISATKEGESFVTKIAFEWLANIGDQDAGTVSADMSIPPRRYVTEFECTNIIQLQEQIIRIQGQISDSQDHLRVIFESEHAQMPFFNSFSRTQALRVLSSLPSLAEKRSRLLVPVLLEWGLDQPTPTLDGDDMNEEHTDTSPRQRWARKDQKSMLSIFANFNNPKVLYRADEVKAALMVLLGNGDVDIQRAALKALLTWKEPAVNAYQEHLLNLLDDARFRDELPIFFGEGKLQEEDVAHVLPIVLRLLYGKVIAGNQGLESKRKAVFVGLKNRFGDDSIRQFLKIAFGPLDSCSIMQDNKLDEDLLQRDVLDTRKQFGMLNLLHDLLATFQSTFNTFTPAVVDPVLYCVIKSSRQLSMTVDGGTEKDKKIQTSLLRNVRQRALHILAKLFENSPHFNWELYAPTIVTELVEPRLDQLPIETAQSVSGLLRLFSAWSNSAYTAPLLTAYNGNILNKVIDCLGVASAKDEIRCFVLDSVLRRIISHVNDEAAMDSTESKLLTSRIHSNIIQPYAVAILKQVDGLLRQSHSKEVLESGVQTVAELAPHVVGSTESRSMIEIATFLLRQPSKRVNPKTKLGLLKILHEFIQRCDNDNLSELFDTIYDAVCPMFAFVQDRTARKLLCDVVQDLATHEQDLISTAKLCHDLNSFATGRIDEPDFECRSQAYSIINEQGYRSFSLQQWKPLIYNMLFFIKDNDELSIRVNASLSLRRFIEAADSEDFRKFVLSAIVPGIHHGVKESSELVRVEFLAVLERLVQLRADWPSIVDLHILLSDDEESSFFSNILHIQGHRRLRALRRLAANASALQSGNVYHILLPLLEHFVFNKATDEGADSLLGETIKTLAALIETLEWPQYRSLLRRYIGYLTSKEDMQKPIIRLVAGLMDGLNQAGRAKGYISEVGLHPDQTDAMECIEGTDSPAGDQALCTLAKTLPQQDKLASDLITHFLPDLTAFLHKKDEATVSLRVPIAVAIAKVLLLLPASEIEVRLPAVLLDICYILKSRAQEARDMSRNTLSEIAVLMGPAYLGFILKALRTALQRGYQLHVLSFTLHHILVKLSDHMKPGDLDYCLQDIVDCIMDDTFGITGQEKDAEEYISKMKEVKSSKSFDSMDIIARSATPAHIIKLILPIKSLLVEKLNARMVTKIDELFRRIGLGILQNPTVNNRDILVFCYELIQEVYSASSSTEKKTKIDVKNKRYLVNNRGAAKSGARLSTSSYLYKMIRFGLDILRTVLRKHENLQTPQNLAGFLPVIGDSMVQGQEEVQVAAVRLLTTIIKVPMVEMDVNCPVYIDEAMRAIKGALSSNTELAQASLKLMSAVLRERPNVDVKERDIGHLLKRMLPDLDEPDRSGVTFGFLKAVMNRRIEVPEIYEAMDKVAEMMITNQTKSARDMARSHFFQFLTSYTQSEKRFKKQLEFLLKNLRYEHFEGRQSVMEALDLIIGKALPRFPEQAQYDYQGMTFLPLVHTLANDDSSKCREMASLLLKRLFQHASDRRLQSFATDLKTWLEQDENIGLKRLGIQCFGFYFESIEEEGDHSKDLPYVLDQLDTIIDECLTRRHEDDWELLYYAFILLLKLCKKYPEVMFSSSKASLWTAIEAGASYPHAWVKLKAAELLGSYFAHLGVSNKDSGLTALPLEGSGGLQLAEQNMTQLCNAFLRNLLNPEVTEQLCMQSIKNIAFLARCLAINGAKWQWQKADDTEDGAEELEEQDLSMANADAMNSDSEFGGFSPQPESATPPDKKHNEAPPTAIHRLVIRLSGIVRKDKSSLNAKSAIMSLFDTIAAKFPLEPFSSCLTHLLGTLNTFVDPATTIPRAYTQASTLNEPDDAYRLLIDKAQEIMNTLQKRLGTQEYLKLMGEVQKAVRDRREERRRKRKVEAVADPEKWGKEKKRRNDIKRVKRKEKGLEHRGKRRGW